MYIQKIVNKSHNSNIYIYVYLQSTLIERVFLIAPLHDIRRRNCLGRNPADRTLTVAL